MIHFLLQLHHGNPAGFWFCFGAVVLALAAAAFPEGRRP